MGWDVLRGNVADSLRLDTARANNVVSDDLIRKLSELKGQGYLRIVIAGQSVGAAEALNLVKRDDAALDAVIAAVPGCCGTSKNPDGTANDRFEKNWTYYNELINGMRSDRRVAVAFFVGDEFEPRDRKQISQLRFAEQNVPNFIIHQPPAIFGHSGAWNTAFSYLYAECLNDFLVTEDTVQSYDCATPTRAADDHRWMTQEFQLANSQATVISGAEPKESLPGTIVTAIHSFGGIAEFQFSADANTVRLGLPPHSPRFVYQFHGKRQHGDASSATDALAARDRCLSLCRLTL